jgi:uncharacterized membrane protein
MSSQSRVRTSLSDRILRFAGVFAYTAGAVMIGTRSSRFGSWEPWALAAVGAVLLAYYFYRQPVENVVNQRTGEPLFESAAQRNVVFGAFIVIMFGVLYLTGRLIAATM